MTTNPFETLSQQIESLRAEVSDLKGRISSPKSEGKKFYSIPEAAAETGVSKITLYRGVESGKIPSKKIGSRVLIPAAYFDRTIG
ncbi:MAG: helix-turn-helix domain-containing protein [Cyclobacteriaceae bacterium]|nr:helix-turn-helix domain-containing protein [Cyclobacteriaceae bacterium]